MIESTTSTNRTKNQPGTYLAKNFLLYAGLIPIAVVGLPALGTLWSWLNSPPDKSLQKENDDKRRKQQWDVKRSQIDILLSRKNEQQIINSKINVLTQQLAERDSENAQLRAIIRQNQIDTHRADFETTRADFQNNISDNLNN